MSFAIVRVILVDVGHSRIKWGLSDATGPREYAHLPLNDETAWERQAVAWGLGAGEGVSWVIAGSNPVARAIFKTWAGRGPGRCLSLETCDAIPLRIDVREPEKVGKDRLLNGLAAVTRAAAQGRTVVIVASLGTAVTVDLLGPGPVFRGGSIFPGVALQAVALHEHTASLPSLTIRELTALPGRSTQEAISAGITHGICGAIERIADVLANTAAQAEANAAANESTGTIPGRAAAPSPAYFLTGGDAEFLAPQLAERWQLVPQMTLEGLWLTFAPDLALRSRLPS